MALNQRYSHNKHIALTANQDYSPGDPVVIGAYAGVAKTAAAEGEKVTVWLDGSYDVEVSGALSEGQVVYLGGSGLTATAGDEPFGISNVSKASGTGTAEVAPFGRRVPAAPSGA